MTVRFIFLGGAGTDEYYFHIVSVQLMQQPRMSHDRGNDRRDGVAPFRMIFCNVVNRCRTCAGNVNSRRGIFQKFSGLCADNLRTQCGFAVSREPQLLQYAAQHFKVGILEISDVARRDRSKNFFPVLHHKPDAVQVGTDFFRVGGTYPHALAAADAQFRNHCGAGVFDLNRFARTMPDAFIAVLTFVRNGVDGKIPVHAFFSPDLPLSRVSRSRS